MAAIHSRLLMSAAYDAQIFAGDTAANNGDIIIAMRSLRLF
jgi:hypothetical protein